jgi:hypothetical protein
MRFGPRIVVLSVLLFAALCAPASSATTLNVFVDNNQVALGAATAIAAHAETDASFGGGHVAFRYKGADRDCAPAPDADDGVDAIAEGQSNPVNVGAGVADVGGQIIQLDVGNWRICGWLVDDANGLVAASGSTVVQVLPYQGSLSIAVDRSGKLFQVTLRYSTSAPTRLYASLQRAAKACPRNPARMPKGSILLVPRAGRFVGSDGGLGRAISARRLAPGRWRVCTWLRAEVGSVGPASKAFAVPQRRPRRGAGAAG